MNIDPVTYDAVKAVSVEPDTANAYDAVIAVDALKAYDAVIAREALIVLDALKAYDALVELEAYDALRAGLSDVNIDPVT